MQNLLSCDEMIKTEKGFFFTSFDSNGLFVCKNYGDDIDLVDIFPQFGLVHKRLYKTIKIADNKLFMPPCSADKISVYDLETNKTEMFEIEPYDLAYKGGYKFWTSFIYGDCVYFVGSCYPAIIKMNIYTMRLRYITDWAAQIDKMRSKISDIKEFSPYMLTGTIVGEYAYFPCSFTNVVIKLNLKTDKTQIIKVNSDILGFIGICHVGKAFWLISRCSNEVISWDEKTNHTEKLILGQEKEDYDNLVPFYEPLLYKNYIYVMPIRGNHVYCIDTLTKEYFVENNLEYIFQLERDERSVTADVVKSPMIIDDKLYFVTGADYKWHEYDLVSKKEAVYEPRLGPKIQEIIEKREKSPYRYFYDEYRRKRIKIWDEDEKHTLFDVIGLINDFCYEFDESTKNKISSDEKFGSSIHKIITEELK